MTDQEWMDFRAKKYKALGNPRDDGRLNMAPLTVHRDFEKCYITSSASREWFEAARAYCERPEVKECVRKVRAMMMGHFEDEDECFMGEGI